MAKFLTACVFKWRLKTLKEEGKIRRIGPDKGRVGEVM